MATLKRSFFISFWRPWFFAVALVGFLGAIVVTVSALTGNPVNLGGPLLAVGCVATFLLLPIGLAVRMSSWDLHQHGIGGRNNWNVYHRLEWEEIDSVEAWLIPGYPYLQINGGGRRWAFWLPLFLTDMHGFRSAVAHFAPLGNPLRRYLEMYLPRHAQRSRGPHKAPKA